MPSPDERREAAIRQGTNALLRRWPGFFKPEPSEFAAEVANEFAAAYDAALGGEAEGELFSCEDCDRTDVREPTNHPEHGGPLCPTCAVNAALAEHPETGERETDWWKQMLDQAARSIAKKWPFAFKPEALAFAREVALDAIQTFQFQSMQRAQGTPLIEPLQDGGEREAMEGIIGKQPWLHGRSDEAQARGRAER